MRPPPTLLASFKEVLSRTAVLQTKGGASKLVRPSLKFQRPVHPPAAATRRHASSSAAHPSSWRAAVDSIFASTFNTIRTGAVVRPGPYSSSRLATRAAPAASRPAGRPLSSAARARFGPSPRPHAGFSTPHTAHVGLGAARQFSSSGFGAWDNLVHNAPLALRALADQFGDGGIDRRKWRADTAGIRRAARTAVKGKGRAPAGFDALEDKKLEFARFFGVAKAAHVDETQHHAAAEPVTLVLAVDPDFDLAVPSPAPSTSTSAHDPLSSFRVLSSSALDSFATISSAYSTHAHHLRVVVNRLAAAGLLDPDVRASTQVGVVPLELESPHAGRRVWRIVFDDALVTRDTVERVVRGEAELGAAATSSSSSSSVVAPPWADKVRQWNRQSAVGAGEGDWWWLVGGETRASLEPSSVLSPGLGDTPMASLPLSPASPRSTAASTARSDDGSNDSSSGAAFLIDAAHALAVAETFVLPDPSSASSSLLLDDYHDELDQPPWTTWTFDSAAGGARSSSLSTISLLDVAASSDDDDGDALDPAASVWADESDVELSASQWGSGSEDGSVIALGEDEGVRGFLRDVEVELGARGAGSW
ncbi:hypothetical protein JCM3775_000722 [Rhodotorula graminis]|uniref:Uncharacterized protein n=1 Tax=Rhodotorula graminis (strain WP1) TaxID=578459 RepID=A0A194S5J9_RHOGW|nr:uncharacterized protein RHOBADRAFT_52812 [Rhodotorula graminis WP1]KPV75785.1 hypothetical protein RHOBADRAFT_52812 [Rhodotorula graminis WP1]